MKEGSSDMHCMSDRYLAHDLAQEYRMRGNGDTKA